MSFDTPVISVVMPVYNAECFLAAAIESVLRQTFRNWELLLVDDASTDNSLRIACEYASKDTRIRVVHNDRNLGVSATRNRGILLARGQWIALLDSDDYWLPDKLNKQLGLADKSQADIIYCSYSIVDAAGNRCCADFLVPESTEYFESLTRSVISCSTAMIRRELLLAFPFPTDYSHEDLVLWLNLLQRGYIARGCQEVLAAYRLSDNTRSKNKMKAAHDRWIVYRRFLHLPIIRCCVLFAKYAIAAHRKYERI